MDALNINSLVDHHKKILHVNNHPYGHCTTKKFLPEEVIKLGGNEYKIYGVGMGNPHMVVYVPTLKKLPLDEWDEFVFILFIFFFQFFFFVN